MEVDGIKFKMQIWDTTGQERFKSLAKNFFRGASGAVFVLDLTDISSYEVTKGWIEQCNSHAPENVCKVMLANKYDITEERVITNKQLDELSAQRKIPYFLVSAKTGENVNEALTALAVEIKRQYIPKGQLEDQRSRGFSLAENYPLHLNLPSRDKKCCGS